MAPLLPILLLAAAAPLPRPDGPPTWTVAPGRLAPIVAVASLVETPREPDPAGARSEDALADAEGWRRWSDALAAEASTGDPSPERRAVLFHLARAQGRWEDAWHHLATCAAEPEVVAALLPRLLPGVEPERLGALPDGALLRPALPPPPELAREETGRTTHVPSMTIEGLAVGATRLRLRVELHPDGIQIDAWNQGDRPTRIAVVLPSATDAEIDSVYSDWARVEAIDAPVELAIPVDDQKHTIWGRFRGARRPWPGAAPPSVPGRIRHGGIHLALGGAEDERERLAAFGRALARLAGVELRPEDAATAIAPLEIDLRDPELRARKVGAITALTERFLLGAR